jgi:acetyl-CoA C-acetyltransferase
VSSNEVLIFDAVRTPRGKARESGALRGVKPVQLLEVLFQALSERQGLSLDVVNDVILGCVTQTGEQGGNIAKVAALYSGLSSRVPGMTINRYCSSGLDACNLAATKVLAAGDELIVAGGVESMSRVPMLSDQASVYTDPALIQAARLVPMGLAADLIASLDGISREMCDTYALQSQQRAAVAQAAGAFTGSIVPVPDPADGRPVSQDESIRPETNAAALAALEPSFADDASRYEGPFRQAFPQLNRLSHVHHRGNSPAMVDGAALVLLGSRAAAQAHGLRPRAIIRAMANASGDAWLALTGGIHAAQLALSRAGLAPNQLDLIEFNEAFAAPTLKFIRELKVDPRVVNVNGGAIALGHPMGATGSILLGALLDELERRAGRFGLVALSGAAGLGTATIIERV